MKGRDWIAVAAMVLVLLMGVAAGYRVGVETDAPEFAPEPGDITNGSSFTPVGGLPVLIDSLTNRYWQLERGKIIPWGDVAHPYQLGQPSQRLLGPPDRIYTRNTANSLDVVCERVEWDDERLVYECRHAVEDGER